VKAVGFAGDVCNADIATSLIRKYPDIDILVNNVGTYEIKSYLEITDADWMGLFNINVLSGARLARLVLPSMQRRNWGRIVFISSESGINIPPEMIHYGMTKAAQLAISRGLAEAVAGSGITVNSVLPGPTWSRGVSRLLKEGAEISTPDAELEAYFFQSIRPSSIIQRFIYPAEVASLVAYVTSMQASAITGAALRVEGGVIRGAY
jgi:NAD(P)-dependent dehydrogenase (short-subunit alcohol dehydrogenase family)